MVLCFPHLICSRWLARGSCTPVLSEKFFVGQKGTERLSTAPTKKKPEMVEQFCCLSDKLKGLGILRNLEACRRVFEGLWINYKLGTECNICPGHPRASMPFSDAIDQFLCMDRGVVVSCMSHAVEEVCCHAGGHRGRGGLEPASHQP